MERAPHTRPRRFSGADRLLGPYVPTLAADWLRDHPRQRHRALDCTLAFADISGFTRMTEMLAAQGKIGAEEMAEVINSTFESLLRPAYAYGASLIKWGGDAAVLLFHGPAHARRAGRAAHEMQRVMRAIGGLRTSRGPVRLRISIGIHSGRFDFFMLGEDGHRELIVAGESVTTLTQMEKDAGAGQIVISDATAAALGDAGEPRPTTAVGRGLLLRTAPRVEAGLAGADPVDYADVDIGVALSESLREHILAGGLESEHRQVTVGFLKLSETDGLLRERGPEVVQAAVEHVIGATQVAAAHNQVAFLATDIAANGIKVMLSAGAPRRAGHDEDRMIATLRAAIDAGGILPLRGGVTTGRVFAGDFGPSFRRTYSIMGDCVNLAARLVERAEPGELLAVEELIEAASGNFRVVAKPSFVAKGKRVPVRPFSLTTPASVRAVAAGEREPMIGRDAAMATLGEAVRAAAAGAGRTLEVVGEPGMGKTTLLAAFQAATEVPVLWADGDVYAIMRPYAPIERLLRSCFELAPDAPPSVVARRLESVVRQRAPQLTPWLPLIGVAAAVPLPSTPEVEQTEPALRKQRLEEVISELLERLLPEPTVIVFNDVHLMDDASRDLIDRLAADTADRRWLLILSRRPDSESPLSREPDGRVELGPLSDEDATELLRRATVAAPLPPHRLASLAGRAHGNPLFLRELVAQLHAGESLETLPRSVEAAIAARIDRLTPPQRHMLRAAAVLGLDVDLPLLRALLSDEDRAFPVLRDEQLGSLSEFLEPIGAGRHRFSHQLVREVAYESLPYRRRRALHARTATVIERAAERDPDEQAELLSLHCLHGARYEDAWRYARIAAERAQARYASAEAADSYARALAAAAHMPGLPAAALVEVDEAVGDTFVELGEMGAADAALRRGLRRTADDPVVRARLQLRLARLRDIEGRHAAAMRWAGRAEQTLSDVYGAEVLSLQGRLAVRRARVRYRQGRHRDAMSFAGAAAERARQANDLRTIAEALEYGDLAAVELGLPSGAGARQALSIYEELGALGDEARVRNTLGMLAYHRGAWREALEQYRAAEDTYLRCGKRWDGAGAMANAAEILVDQGRIDEAAHALERARHIYRGVGAASEVAFAEYQLGRIAARRGQLPEALDLFMRARRHFLASGELTEVLVVDAFNAEACWLAGEDGDALALASATLRRVRAHGGVGTMTPLLQRVRGLALLALGRPQDGARALRDSLAAARSRGADHEIAFTLGALLDAQLASNADESADWAAERSRLASRLGMQSAAQAGGQVTPA